MGTLKDLQQEMNKMGDALDSVRNDPMFGALLDATRTEVTAIRPDPEDDEDEPK